MLDSSSDLKLAIVNTKGDKCALFTVVGYTVELLKYGLSYIERVKDSVIVGQNR